MLEIAVIYLAAAIIAVPIAKRLGLGSVLGYLLAGMLIGPFALSLIGDQTDVMRFAEFGVVMMLFLVGLELQPSHLWGDDRSYGVAVKQCLEVLKQVLTNDQEQQGKLNTCSENSTQSVPNQDDTNTKGATDA